MFGTLDLLFFLGSLALVMAVGLVAARRENTSEDFFLAGRSVRWWGVAGSIFGSNVSANHLVGMLGIGYSIGFAQSHFELGAIVALMLLAYGFLPVYRKLGLFTLSDYLGRRYDSWSQTLYAVILLVVVMVQLTAGFYIGSRSLGLLLAGTALEIGYGGGILALALITASYTIFGGLKAVIYTDVIQSVLLLGAGILVAVLTFAQPEVGGWSGMMAFDQARPLGEQKMHLYLPPSHPDLPWTGALSGLLVLHCFYWSTNQPIVQRALAAKSDREARIGIVVAGFLKLLIPFFAIAGGVAAAQLFEARLPDQVIDPDAATPELIRLVIPAGYGLLGIIMAGLIGAILSSIDSMVNSAATLFTFDLYRKFINRQAGDRQLLILGRFLIAALIAGSAALAWITYDPSGAGNFFLRVSSQAGHFTPGLVTAFALGMFWKGATARGAAFAIIVSPLFSLGITELYDRVLANIDAIAALWGDQLNFLHRVFLTMLFGSAVHLIVSSTSAPSREGQGFTIAALEALPAGQLARALRSVAGVIILLFGLGAATDAELLPQRVAAAAAALIVWLPFLPWLRDDSEHWLGNDRLWSALLCSITAFLMFEFF